MTARNDIGSPKNRYIDHSSNKDRMNINTLAKLTLFGLAYIYTVKLIDTIYHGVFRLSAVAGTVVGLNILAGLVGRSFCRRSNCFRDRLIPHLSGSERFLPDFRPPVIHESLTNDISNICKNY